MKFTQQEIHSTGDRHLSFYYGRSNSLRLFQSSDVTAKSQLGTRSKKSSNLIQLDVKKESVNLRRPHLYDEINP